MPTPVSSSHSSTARPLRRAPSSATQPKASPAAKALAQALAPDDLVVPEGLVYVNDAAPGIRRLKRGNGFAYRRADGKPVRDARELDRIRRLAIPPAYRDVWICPSPDGHLQATGLDARGRKQYRYHALWRSERDADKFGRMSEFALALPRVRRRVKEVLCATASGKSHGRDDLLAAVARLLDTTCCRIGNAEYARDNGSFGLCTLKSRHVTVEGTHVSLAFRGKSGVQQQFDVEDACLARVLSQCLALSRRELLRWRDEDGRLRGISSSDVNAWLHEVAGEDFSAKDFRTWHATSLAFLATTRALAAGGKVGDSRFTLKLMLGAVAEVLGNTPAVCRKSYVHPRVIDFATLAAGDPEAAQAWLARADRSLAHPPRGARGLKANERALLAFLATPRPDTEKPARHAPRRHAGR